MRRFVSGVGDSATPLARAETLKGRELAQALGDGLAEVDPRFVPRFYGDRVAQLRAADPSDPTGYLAFLDDRRASMDFRPGWTCIRA